MRLWSINPSYLDTKGLIAVWREALLAKKVLEGKTKGYKNHSQLVRFKEAKNPIIAINTYLFFILEEAKTRGFNFNADKVDIKDQKEFLKVTTDQLDYEFEWLQTKLRSRDDFKFKENYNFLGDSHGKVFTHPMFDPIDGKIALWEKLSK